MGLCQNSIYPPAPVQGLGESSPKLLRNWQHGLMVDIHASISTSVSERSKGVLELENKNMV